MNRPLASTASGTRFWKFSSQVSPVNQGVVCPAQLSNVPSSSSVPKRAAAGPSARHGVRASIRRLRGSRDTATQAPVLASRRTRTTETPTSRL